jgi:hypothetical protein
MEKKILTEINRMKKLMGQSLILESRGSIIKFIEDLLTSPSGREGVESILTSAGKTNSEVKTALNTLESAKKPNSRVSDLAVKDAYSKIIANIDKNLLVKSIISKNMIPDITKTLKAYQEAAQLGKISQEAYSKWFDDFIDESFAHVDDDMKDLFKTELETKYKPSLISTSKVLGDRLIEDMKINPLYKNIFDSKISVKLNLEDKIKRETENIYNLYQLEKNPKNIEKVKEEALKKFDEIKKIINEDKTLTKQQKTAIQNWFFNAFGNYNTILKIGKSVGGVLLVGVGLSILNKILDVLKNLNLLPKSLLFFLPNSEEPKSTDDKSSSKNNSKQTPEEPEEPEGTEVPNN